MSQILCTIGAHVPSFMARSHWLMEIDHNTFERNKVEYASPRKQRKSRHLQVCPRRLSFFHEVWASMKRVPHFNHFAESQANAPLC
jgi:hypothetical protein